MPVCIHKLALFAIWKVSSAVLGPTGRKTPAGLRQSSAGAQSLGSSRAGMCPAKRFPNSSAVEQELSLQGQNDSLCNELSLLLGIVPSKCLSPLGSEKFLGTKDNENMLGHWQLQGQGPDESTQACWGQRMHGMGVQPLYVSFLSA